MFFVQCRTESEVSSVKSTDGHLSEQVFLIPLYTSECNISVKLDECATYLETYNTQQWTEEEKNLPLAFAILDHR